MNISGISSVNRLRAGFIGIIVIALLMAITTTFALALRLYLPHIEALFRSRYYGIGLAFYNLNHRTDTVMLRMVLALGSSLFLLAAAWSG